MPAGPEDFRSAPLPAELDRILHDLRGPLNAALMHFEVVRRLLTDEPAAAPSLRAIQQELERLATMLEAAAGVVALEPGEWRRVDLGAVVGRVVAGAGAPVVVRGDGAWPHVMGDERLLDLAVGHLVQNAVDATRAAGSTTPPEVRADPAADGCVALAVRDHGPGLRSTNPKVLIRLLGSTRPGRPGLGLLTVERIARIHHGRLCFESPSPGARVTLVLPAAE